MTMTTTHDQRICATTLRSAVLTLAEKWLERPGNEPHIIEAEEDGSIVVRLEIPGIDPDRDIDVTVTDGLLRIVAVRSRHVYARSFQLRAGVECADVSVDYRDGVLTVRAPIDPPTAATCPAYSPASRQIGRHR